MRDRKQFSNFMVLLSNLVFVFLLYCLVLGLGLLYLIRQLNKTALCGFPVGMFLLHGMAGCLGLFLHITGAALNMLHSAL
jgi:hypothetical protein